MAILTRKLKNLPPATSLSDTDIVVGENEIETQKITLYQIVNFICNHNIIQNAFAAKSLFEEHIADMVMHITSSERTNWNDAYNKRHEHDNKEVIDKLTQTMLDNWDDSNSKKHVHSNKDVLDGISQENISNWDDAVSKEHTHDNKTVLDNIDQTNIDNWNDANSKKHIHNNKDILDSITQDRVDTWDAGGSGGGDGHVHTNKAVLDKITLADYNSWTAAGKYYAASTTAGGAATKAVGDSLGNKLSAEIISNTEPTTQNENGHWLAPY